MRPTHRLFVFTVTATLLFSGSLAQAIDYSWANPINGDSSNVNNWDPNGTPNDLSLVTVPAFSNQSYTINHNVTWTVDDLKTYGYATVHLNGYGLTVDSGGDFYDNSTLKITNATYNPTGSVLLHDNAQVILVNGTIAGTLGTGTGNHVYGYGYIGSLPTNSGHYIAQNGELSISIGGNSNEGELSADTGGTLYVRDQDHLSNHNTISLNGGILKGYSNSYEVANYAAGDTITGRGTIRNFKVNVGAGSLVASGGTLSLEQGFSSNQSSGTVTAQSGGTLNVGVGWTNYANLTLNNGSITGQTMSQNGFMYVKGIYATDTVQNVTFNNGVDISEQATLNISGTATLQGATITKSGAGGYFSIANGALVQGRGTINPDVYLNGTLNANSNGNTLAVNGVLTIQAGKSAYGSSGGTLALNKGVVNYGNLYASGGTVTVEGGGEYGYLLALPGSSTYASSGTLNLNNLVINRSTISASGGTVNINGTIETSTLNTGDFAASSTMNINGTIETNARNTFTANTGGTINLPGSPNTGNLYQTEALRPRGGTFNIASGQTLTNNSGKSIKGYGTLLSDGRNLANQGTIEADSGTLTVHGNITNTGSMRAASGSTLTVGSTLTNSAGGQIYAQASSTVNLNSSDLTNNAGVYTNGSSALVTVADTTPQGSGTFTANTGGTIRFANGATNAGLSTTNALELAGGKISVASGSMTNASGKQISGFGTLLDGGTTLNNSGEIVPQSGTITINGNVSNAHLISASGTDTANIYGMLTNQSGGTVTSNAAQMYIAAATNEGLIEVVGGGGGGGRISFGNAVGAGRYRFNGGSMEFGGLDLGNEGQLDDQFTGASVSVARDLVKLFDSAPGTFHADHLSVAMFAELPGMHRLVWQAQDRGAILEGLDDNLALGHLTFGDGLGLPGSDPFMVQNNTTIYCYGLSLLADADVDLGGYTIYYLRDGVEYNGLTGQGFEDLGTYHNGNIIEIVPEPMTVTLLGLGMVLAARRRTPRRAI